MTMKEGLGLMQNIIILILMIVLLIGLSLYTQSYISEAERKLPKGDIGFYATDPYVTCRQQSPGSNRYILTIRFDNVYVSDPQGRSFAVIPVVETYGAAFEAKRNGMREYINVQEGGGSAGLIFEGYADTLPGVSPPTHQIDLRLALFKNQSCMNFFISGSNLLSILNKCAEAFIPPIKDMKSRNNVTCATSEQ